MEHGEIVVYKTAQDTGLKIEVKIEDESVCEILRGKKTKPDCLTFVRDNRDYNTNIQKILPTQFFVKK